MKHLRALLLLTLLIVGVLVLTTGSVQAASRRTCPAPSAINPMPTPPAPVPTACLPAEVTPAPAPETPCPVPLAAEPPLVCQAPACPPPAVVPETTPAPTPAPACPPPVPPTPTAACPNACPPGSPVGNNPVPAVTSRSVTNPSGIEMGEVWIGNSMALRINAPAGGYSAGRRAEIVATRLQNALCQGRTWQDVMACRLNNEPVLLIGSSLLVTIDRQTALTYNTTPVRLAMIWRANMQSMLRTAAVAEAPAPVPGA